MRTLRAQAAVNRMQREGSAACLHQWNAWGSRVTLVGKVEWHRECRCGAAEVRRKDPLA